ncbi:MAG: shikimate dehydrogenase [Gammaproteobacteria bacterium]|nr:shikimate dehydrogenase [Gammaproteobacteria bacterium]
MPGGNLFAVVGNPIGHSLSPRIHQAFSEQFNLNISYEAIEIPQDDFVTDLRGLQQLGYKGLNVTVPFKQQAAEVCDRKSPRAEDASAVNTIIFSANGEIAGDNTDGVGLTRDLVNNNSVLIKRRKILLLGAGGAVRGVLPSILALSPANLTLANRTVEKAEKLAEDFEMVGDIIPSSFEELGRDKFDLIINGTSAGLKGEVPPIPAEVLGINSVCYDMMYNLNNITNFVQWAQNHGASRTLDGLGMLVEQAAESFFIWHGVRVNTAIVIASLRSQR